MPKKSHHQAIGRLLEILKRLPTRGAGISARELTDWLTDEGFEVSKRTVERDLSALAVHFQLVYNDKSVPYGWRFRRRLSARVQEGLVGRGRLAFPF